MSFIKFILALLKWALLAFISLLALYILSSNFNIFGHYRPFLVQSGSMEPAIMTGDVIVIKSQDSYVINEVVTFHNNSGRVVTHRIVAVEKGAINHYATKGDANRSGDEDSISDEQIIGKVILVIPKLGYLVAFTKSKWGLIMLLLIPATIFIIDELLKIRNAKPRD